MTPSRTCGLVAVGAVAVCLGVAAWLGASASRAQAPEESHDFALAANAFGTEFRLGDPVPLLVALGSARDETVALETSNQYYIGLTDAAGGLAPHDPVLEPMRGPGYHWMELGGQQDYVAPVQEVGPRSGALTFVPNALEGYHPTPGTYTLVAATHITTYGADSVFPRDGLPYKLWARRDSATSRFGLESNPVTIEIR